MNNIYLLYESNIASGNVSISSSYDEKLLRLDRYTDFERRDVILTSETPRQLLQNLEERIIKETEERVSTRDIIEGTELDNNPKHKNYPRHIGFLPKGTLSGFFGKEDPKERKKVDQENKTRHSKIFQAYKNFIEGLI
ncbi:Uncharacterised protein [uncultured archaeon]|nr:Uncharacterised protein [uncultured archaeon]